VSSSKKRERARRTSESSGVKSEPHSRRIVSGFKGGSLQITILQGEQSLWFISVLAGKVGLQSVMFLKIIKSKE